MADAHLDRLGDVVTGAVLSAAVAALCTGHWRAFFLLVGAGVIAQLLRPAVLEP